MYFKNELYLNDSALIILVNIRYFEVIDFKKRFTNTKNICCIIAINVFLFNLFISKGDLSKLSNKKIDNFKRKGLHHS